MKSSPNCCVNPSSSTRASPTSSPSRRATDYSKKESQHLAMLGDFIGKKISLQVETAYQQEQYDVILM